MNDSIVKANFTILITTAIYIFTLMIIFSIVLMADGGQIGTEASIFWRAPDICGWKLGRGLRGSALPGVELRRGEGGSHLQINWKAGVRAPSRHNCGAVSATDLNMCSESTSNVHSGKGWHHHPSS